MEAYYQSLPPQYRESLIRIVSSPQTVSSCVLQSTAIVVLFVVPLVGVVTRFRINFTPKGVGLGELDEGDGQRLSQDMRVGPVVNSVLPLVKLRIGIGLLICPASLD